MIHFEQENLEAYKLILRIEIVLRECVRISMESEIGVGWQKRIPGELLKKIKEAQKEENQPQYAFLRLGPLYYLTFGELLNLLNQKACSSLAKQLGGACVLKELESLQGPRNALCHSRPVSTVGLKTIETVYAALVAALTEKEFARLIAKPDTGLPQSEASKSMIASLRGTLQILPDLPDKLRIPEAYSIGVTQFWWLDDSLAGFKRSTIEEAVAIILEYNELPQGVGSAGSRQRCCEQKDLKNKIHAAIVELEKVNS